MDCGDSKWVLNTGHTYTNNIGKEENYIITYKDLFGKKTLASGTAFSKANAMDLFKRNFNDSCEIIKVQTSSEWVEETAEFISDNMMKHVKSLEGVAVK